MPTIYTFRPQHTEQHPYRTRMPVLDLENATWRVMVSVLGDNDAQEDIIFRQIMPTLPRHSPQMSKPSTWEC